MKFEKAILFLAMVLALASLAAAVYFHSTNVRYGFVNTEKILESFGESQKVSGEIRAEEERWLTEARIIEDSLAAFEARIQKDYGKLSVKEKLELKKEHAARIGELERFNEARKNALLKMQREKLEGVYGKINSAMDEFARSSRLDVVFATSDGSIVFGDGGKADLTEEFVRFLNSRYK